MSGSISNDKAEPNLTPILDMVFQLITFFMLVINFKSAALDMSLKLPVIGSARPVESGADILILNIDTEGALNITGNKKRGDEIERYIGNEAVTSQRVNHITPGDDLPTIVVVRADISTPFSLLNRVIKACQDRGFRTFALRAKASEAT